MFYRGNVYASQYVRVFNQAIVVALSVKYIRPTAKIYVPFKLYIFISIDVLVKCDYAAINIINFTFNSAILKLLLLMILLFF